MDTEAMANKAMAMFESKEADSIEQAAERVVCAELYRIAGSFTVQAENAWTKDVIRFINCQVRR